MATTATTIHPKLTAAASAGAAYAILVAALQAIDELPDFQYRAAILAGLGVLIQLVAGYVKAGGAKGMAVDQASLSPAPRRRRRHRTPPPAPPAA